MRALVLLALVGCSEDSVPRKLQWLEASPGGEVAPIIAGELAQAIAARDSLLVYVGAAWCEPCRAFHDAAAAGKLDDKLGGVRLLEFDADRDGDALAGAGYQSSLIPLFAVPRIDGRASGKQTEGAFKDRDAVEQLVPRLHALLQR